MSNQKNCSASYALAALSATQDRICMKTKTPVQLSTQEIVDCDKTNYGCEGGYVTRVLNFGRRKGFIPEQCYPFTGVKGECDEDHYDTNECRMNNLMYKIIDYCISQDELAIKKEILKNGPVIA